MLYQSKMGRIFQFFFMVCNYDLKCMMVLYEKKEKLKKNQKNAMQTPPTLELNSVHTVNVS